MTATIIPTTTATPPFDLAKAEAFAGQMVGIINSGAIALMTSIGHRTGLFDTMATLPPCTSEAIAATANLQERYVREWLAAMTTAGIVSYDATAQTYHLPAEHAAFLTRAAKSDNLAVFTQYIPVLANVEEQIIHCFQHGGGVPYAAYPRFHEVMAEDSGVTVVAALADYILPAVPGLLSALQQGIEVMDLGCGRGRALNRMAQLFPNSQFTGYDFSEGAIAIGQAEATELGLTNVRFAIQDAAQLAEVGQYDCITTFDAIHDQAHPDVVLQNICRALADDGVYLMQDIRATTDLAGNLEHPVAPFLYTISCLHCMTVSLAEQGMGLGTMWGEAKAVELLTAAGFTQVEVIQLPHDVINNYYIIRK